MGCLVAFSMYCESRFFFVKQKPSYEWRISDWSSDVCSSDLRRVSFRRAMKRSVQSSMRLGAQGIRVNCGGRLGGAEIARMEWYREGRVPLQLGRASCRARVCQYVSISVFAVSLTKKYRT